jgi:endonuclease G
MSLLSEASDRQHETAADRVETRTGQRRKKIKAIKAGRLVQADEPIRIASRINRLSRYYPGVRPVSPSALEANNRDAVQPPVRCWTHHQHAGFRDVRYLEAGTRASHTVAGSTSGTTRAGWSGSGPGPW